MARTFTKNLSNFASLGTGAMNAIADGAGAITIAAWIKYATADAGASSNRIFTGVINSNATGFLLCLNGDGASPPYLRVGGRSTSGDTFQSVDGGSTLSASTWYHVAGVLDYANDTITPYVNGVADSVSTSVTFGATTYTSGTPTVADYIGCNGSAGVPVNTLVQFNGQIADLAIWFSAKMPSEILAMAKGVSPMRFNPRRYWPMSQATSTAIRELTRGGPHATVTGSIPYAAHPPVGMPWTRNRDVFNGAVEGGGGSSGYRRPRWFPGLTRARP